MFPLNEEHFWKLRDTLQINCLAKHIVHNGGFPLSQERHDERKLNSMNESWLKTVNYITFSLRLDIPKTLKERIEMERQKQSLFERDKNLLKERNNWIAPYFTPTMWGQFFYSTLWIRNPMVRDSVIFLWFVTLETKTQSSETNSSTFPKVLYCIFLPTISIIV